AAAGPGDVDAVAQGDRGALARGRDWNVGDLLLALELTRGVDRQVLAAHLQHAPRGGDVARRQDLAEFRGGNAVGGETLLGVFEVDLLAQDARRVDLGDLRHGLQSVLDAVREIVELAVGVSLPGDRRQAGAGVVRVADHRGLPDIRVELGRMQALLEEVVDERQDGGIVEPETGVDAGEPRPDDGPGVAREPGGRGVLDQKVDRALQHPGADDLWDAGDHADAPRR